MLRHRMENSRHGRDRPAPLPVAAHRTAPGSPPATPPVPSTGRALLRVARDVAQYCCVMGALVWITLRGTAASGYDWQWHRLWRHLFTVTSDGGLRAGPLLDGLGVTLQVVAASLALALLAGLLAALLRQSGSRVGRALAVGYVETVRNTPLLIQLFVVYFVLAPVLGMGRFAAGVLALSLFEGAYIAEILRAGILSVPTGQWEASRSLGMDVPGTYMEVVLPQAARTALPPLTGQLVSLVKDSSLVSTIALHDLAMQAQAVAADTFLVFEVWFLVAGMYLALTLALSALAQLLERRLRYEF
ncbi:amino acid ABC transporter permease [Nitratidesulfovibrio sp. D1]|uniref:amino acid ABC transporter permease n=1 Tax=Nitratidesulfovibrio sp. D1 TaxID=3440151 RepID=UPI003EB94946